MKNKMNNIFKNFKKAIMTLYAMAFIFAMNTSTALAATPTPAPANTAEAKWDTIIGFIVPWVERLGGVVIFIGAVEFGLAFKDNDAEGKTKGMRTIIAGAIVFAVALSSDIFLV